MTFKKSKDFHKLTLKAADIIRGDNEINALKQDIKSLTERENIKSNNYKSQIEELMKKNKELEKEIENNKKLSLQNYYMKLEKYEEHETKLREELLKTEQLLSNKEADVAKLRIQLQRHESNQRRLLSWKLKNTQLLKQLEEERVGSGFFNLFFFLFFYNLIN